MKLIVANLKMTKDYKASLSWASFLMKNLKSQRGVIVCPSALCLSEFVDIFKGSKIEIGAQDVSGYKSEAVTGDVSAKMLKSLGVNYAIVGHSERRRLYGLSSEQVKNKIERCLENDMLPIVCLSGKSEDKKGLRNELSEILLVTDQKIILAYEPESAIGSGKHMDPNLADKTISYIKSQAKKILGYTPKVVYGGSVCKDNIHEFLQKKHIDGLLIGTAAKEVEEFCQLCESRG